MRYTILLLILTLVPAPNQGELNPKAEKVLKAWVDAQNQGSDAAVIEFIKTYYPESAYESKEKLGAHLNFCRQIIDEFGEIQADVYKVMVNKPKKLKVQLLKAGALAISQPSPEHILVVEIDLEESDGTKLSRGLGMGALICYIKR